MSRIYCHLTIQERAVVMTMRDDQCSIRTIAKRLGRSPSSISREIRRNAGTGVYDANVSHIQSATRRVQPRRTRKLESNSVLFQVVRHYLKLLWSPQQISNILKAMWPNETNKTVSHETIYNAIYLHPRGELKRELIACLRHHNQVRKPRSRGTDRRGQIKDMQSIHIRPPEIEDRVIPGHWEGDLIKGEGNRSSVGTLVERTTRFVVLAKMDNAGTKSVVDSFSAVLNREPTALRKSMTYDQGREMHGHKILTERTGVQIYFADPHSPWQRGSNENTNGLLRQYMPKGSDLSIYSQEELDAIALSMNTRPRQTLGWKTPLAVYTEHMIRLQLQADSVH
ncbi:MULTISPECIES: IS30 family transposase [unclassified Janthinobacterium]|uniref:IS30 family transposase n=1 Tax=unclassified Janthinobacterium TaxID=2610881 RepID=UPI0016127ABE|nr:MULTISPECIES: IS30 family transposase [unclassified Janthinobacterium]MBB5610759.1 IS30 family transposase [Janthinobacterium sp. S3T4]MBB5616245.1 IS30 family transposase [Janthinobacterium sp. S3M3]